MASDERTDWLGIAERAIGVGVMAYTLWILCPSIRVPVSIWLNRVRQEWAERQLWESTVHQMSFETWFVRQEMEGSTDGLAERLNIE